MCLIMTEDGWFEIGGGKCCTNENQLNGVFQEHDAEIVGDFMMARAERFCQLMSEGEASKFNEPLYGAFGEKL